MWSVTYQSISRFHAYLNNLILQIVQRQISLGITTTKLNLLFATSDANQIIFLCWMFPSIFEQNMNFNGKIYLFWILVWLLVFRLPTAEYNNWFIIFILYFKNIKIQNQCLTFQNTNNTPFNSIVQIKLKNEKYYWVSWIWFEPLLLKKKSNHTSVQLNLFVQWAYSSISMFFKIQLSIRIYNIPVYCVVTKPLVNMATEKKINDLKIWNALHNEIIFHIWNDIKPITVF